MKSNLKLGLVVAIMTIAILLGAGIVSTTFATDTASCYCTKPVLSLSQSSVYWESMAAYTDRILSVEYEVSNMSDNYANAKDLTVVGTNNTNGVTSVDNGRVINMVPAGECEILAMKYNVPPGVSSFSSTVYAVTKDQCNNSYAYPSVMP